MWCRLTDEDAEEDEGYRPEIFLKCVDYGEAEDRHDVRDDGDDDATNADCHGVIGNGTQDLTTDNNVDHGKAAADQDVENGTKLGAPKAEGIS